MDERRKYLRFPVQLDARYREKLTEDWKECSVVDISREGMGLSIYSRDTIREGTPLCMQITSPVAQDSIAVEGILTWIRDCTDDPHFNYLCGVALSSITSEDKWVLLDYAYERFAGKKDS